MGGDQKGYVRLLKPGRAMSIVNVVVLVIGPGLYFKSDPPAAEEGMGLGSGAGVEAWRAVRKLQICCGKR